MESLIWTQHGWVTSKNFHQLSVDTGYRLENPASVIRTDGVRELNEFGLLVLLDDEDDNE